MDNTSNHSKTWSDADIRMYLKGELSPREMHDIERAALDDPFLADALEGLVSLTPADTGLDDLRSRLAARVEKKEHRPAIAWFRRPAFRAAAVVIGLVGIGLTAYYSLSDRRPSQEKTGIVTTNRAPVAPTQTPAAAQTRAAPTPLAAATDSAVAKANEKTDTHLIATSSYYAKADKRDAAKRADAYKHEQKAGIAERPAEADRDLALEKVADRARALRPRPQQSFHDAFLQTDSLKLNTDREAATQQGYFNFTPATIGQPSLVFSGRVLDNNNRPLAGASVFLNNTPKTITTTDALGNFDFRIRPRDTTQQMTVALVGYKQTLVSLNTNALTNNVIHLEEAKANLGEVVVTGYGAKRKETYAAAPSDAGSERLDTAWLKAAPVIGKPAYQQYLDSAKRSLKLDPTIFGTESISFQVDQKGQITEFKIEHSLSPAHDAGLIQLINTGPPWRSLRGRKGRTVVSLNFP